MPPRSAVGDRFKRDKSDPSVIVFSEINVVNVHSIFSKSKNRGARGAVAAGGSDQATATSAWVERFDRRGTELFELFRSEFGQKSFKIQVF